MEIENAETRLGCGLDLRVSRNPSATTLTISLLGRRGALDDPAGKAGLAHLAEHLWASATLEGEPAAELVEEVGGNLEGATYPLFVRLEVQVPAVQTAVGVEVMSGLFRHGPSADNAAVEKKAILTEYHEAREDLAQRVSSLMWDALGRDSIYHGFREALYQDVESLTQADVHGWVRLLGSDQLVLHVQTSLDPAELLPVLTRAFEGEARLGTPRTPHPFDGGRKTLVRVGRMAEEGHFALGVLFAQPSPGPREYAAAQVLASLLAGGNRGRLTRKLRHETGLVYDISGSYLANSEMGSLEFYTFAEQGSEGRVLGALLDEFSAAANGDFSPSELARAKAFACGSYLVEMENPARLARWVTNRYMAMGWAMKPTEWYDYLSAVEGGDVEEAARALFGRSTAVWGVAAPSGAAVDEAFGELGPLEEVGEAAG